MAVIQISKMQVRRGQTAQTGFPQLSSGEFGWSIDTQELFIGNGSVAEGAPAVGNTEIITEHNIANFFLAATTGYKYKNLAETVYRTIQDKLDDFVTLKDFTPADVATVTDYTSIIQTAVDYASSVGKPLYIAENLEGTSGYTITATIFIPPQTEIRGAGPGKTTIVNLTTSSVSFQTASADGKFGVTGVDAIQGDTNQPKNIRISGISFLNTLTNTSAPILRLDCTLDSVVEHCDFIGDNVVASTATTILAEGIELRDIASWPANTTKNIAIRNCKFNQLSTAIASDYDISDVVITQNRFESVDEGIILGRTLTGLVPQIYGPQHIQISNNTFFNVNKQAIFGGSTSTTYATDINSTNNYFHNVGNFGRGDTTSTMVTEVIRFNSFGNYSNGDTFDRLRAINSGTSFLTMGGPSVISTVKPIISGPVELTTKNPEVYNISGSGVNQFFALPRSTFSYQGGTSVVTPNPANQVITMDYTINKPAISLIRKGTLDVIVSSTSTTVRDSYTSSVEETSGGVVFAAEVSTVTNLVKVTLRNNSSVNGNIIYTYTVRQ